jgi:hypothetical protein
LQIAASIAVAVVVMALVVWGLLWTWHRIKRYRLAVGFAGLTVGFGIIRFISLHEVDAWNVNAPWARTAIDLVAAAGVSAVAIARLCQLQPGEASKTKPALRRVASAHLVHDVMRRRLCGLAIPRDDRGELPECHQFLHLFQDLLFHPAGDEDAVASAGNSRL